jgi:hypothetical protein
MSRLKQHLEKSALSVRQQGDNLYLQLLEISRNSHYSPTRISIQKGGQFVSGKKYFKNEGLFLLVTAY